MEDILSGARKYGLGMVMAHQQMQQVLDQSRSIYESILSNAGTRICFRLGDTDAKKLAGGFAHYDEPDLKNLGTGKAIMRVGKAEDDFLLTTYMLDEPEEEKAQEMVNKIIDHSRMRYAKSRTLVEHEYYKQFQARQQAQEEEEQQKKTSARKKTPLFRSEQEETPQEPQETIEMQETASLEQEPQKTPETSLEAPQELEKVVSVQSDDALRDKLAAKEQERQHVLLQNKVKQLGQTLGYLSVIEKATPGGSGRVDVGLSNDDTSIAVEISVTTSVEHEVQNIQKCLNAGYAKVIAMSEDAPFRSKLLQALKATLSDAELGKVQCMPFAKFEAFMHTLAPQEPPEEKRIKGYRVTTGHVEITEMEREQKEKMMRDILERG